MGKSEHGYFLIADITGYTVYLNKSELEHAHHVLQTLLELLVDHTRPPLVISRLAGDAVISYGLQDNFLSGQAFIEMIEDTYVAFRRAINLMVLNNSCQCDACANISSLDLKFFVHHGVFTLQRLREHDELLGSDVNIIHRLLKNRVNEKTGFRAYTLYTDAAVRRLGIGSIAETMAPHGEVYEDVGEIHAWVQDMHPVWEAKKDQARIEIGPNDRLVDVAAEFPLPVHVMWDIITDTDYRAIFVQSIRQVVHNRKGGRVGPGSVYECFHGDNRVTRQTILEWLPLERMTTEDTTPVPGATVLISLRLTPAETGTRLEIIVSKARGKWLNRWVCDLVGRFIVPKQFRGGMRDLVARIEEEMAEGLHELPKPAAIPADQIGEAAELSLRGGG